MKYYDLDEQLIFWWEDGWACIRECASSLMELMMVFGVLYSDLVGPSWRHVDWREPVSWKVSVSSWWVILEVIWNRVPWSFWVVNTLVGLYGISLQVEWWEGMYGTFRLDSWAEVGSLQLILEFGESCRWQWQTQFGSGMIIWNQLYVYWRFIF